MTTVEKVTKPQKISSAEKRRRQDERNRRESAQYLTAKKHIVEREKENYTKLAFLKSNRDGWYKGWDHTAIIFAHELADKIGVKARFLVDRDYNYPARYGFVSIPNMEKVATLLSGLGVKKSYEKDDMVVFVLNKKYTEDDIQAMLENEQMIVEEANQLFLPKEKMPQLKQQLQDLARCVYEMVRKMEKTGREAFGNVMVREAGLLIRDFYLMANDKIGRDEYFKEVEGALDRLNGWFLMCLNIGMSYPKKIMRAMEFSNSARTQLRAEIKKTEKRDEKKTEKKVRKKADGTKK